MSSSTPAALRFMRHLQRRPGGGRSSEAAATGAEADVAPVSAVAAGDTAGAASAWAGQAAGGQLEGSAALGVRQLTRLTLATDDAASAAGLSIMQSVTSSYDLLAIQPLSERVLQQVRALSPEHCRPPPCAPGRQMAGHPAMEPFKIFFSSFSVVLAFEESAMRGSRARRGPPVSPVWPLRSHRHHRGKCP